MSFSYLQELESEAIYVIREVTAQFKRPVLLFSGGKDSTVLAHLAKKAFSPWGIPFPFLHIDTGHNFKETIEFRDALIGNLGVELLVGSVQDLINTGVAEEALDSSRNSLQSIALKRAIADNTFDAAIGGGRRDEEKARAKERFFSHRDVGGGWQPNNQRPEIWNLFNGRIKDGEHFRAFPISNWTELDVWRYIQEERLVVPELYFAHNRKCFSRNGVILADEGILDKQTSEESKIMTVRFRTVGDITCTGAVCSKANTIQEIIAELEVAKQSERGSRVDDKLSTSAMEDRKRAGYF
ncbi:MAG: sulfate adenylyltransferase subunit CysD [Candidatus Uhrbacteria bacterium]|nr:sulfate adenylyltransferase subunit CysD [Candidatus Uhrbacteria bacterium]